MSYVIKATAKDATAYLDHCYVYVDGEPRLQFVYRLHKEDVVEAIFPEWQTAMDALEEYKFYTNTDDPDRQVVAHLEEIGG